MFAQERYHWQQRPPGSRVRLRWEKYVDAEHRHYLYIQALRRDDWLRRLPTDYDDPEQVQRLGRNLIRSMGRVMRRRRAFDAAVVASAQAIAVVPSGGKPGR